MKRRLGIVVFGALSLALLAAASLIAAHALRLAPPTLGDLAPLPVAGHHRLLVLAPHCDDETLGPGGLILAAERMGMDIRVVVATNGDGYLFATMEEFRRFFPRNTDFLRMGNERQSETLSAMRLLGVSPDRVSFLSYPDRGTPALWNEYWQATDPYRSPYTGTTRSPYALTYDAQAVYSGEDVLADLESILDSYHPDLIVYPHPEDAHPDHWGLAAFTRLAIALAEEKQPHYRPDAYGYLVHRPDFPRPRGLNLNASLLPPAALFEIGREWFRLDLAGCNSEMGGYPAIPKPATPLALTDGKVRPKK